MFISGSPESGGVAVDIVTHPLLQWVQQQMENGVQPLDLLTQVLGSQAVEVAKASIFMTGTVNTQLSFPLLARARLGPVRSLGNPGGNLDTPSNSSPAFSCVDH